MVIRKPNITLGVIRPVLTTGMRYISKLRAAGLYKHYIKTPWFASFSLTVCLVYMVAGWQGGVEYASLSPSSGSALPSSFVSTQAIDKSSFKPLTVDLRLQDKVLPNILTQSDVAIYKDIVEAQKTGKWSVADAHIAKLKNRLLVGHLLAKRYLDTDYKTSAGELASWLKHYKDHPQASRIYELAVSKVPSLKSELPVVIRHRSLQGYGEDNGLTHLGNDMPYASTWRAGIAAWKAGRTEEAVKHFTTIATNPDKISPWMASASAYWAYRAYKKLDNSAEANHYLNLAAENPRSFYGIIACKQLHRPLDLQVNPVALTETDVLEIIGDPAIRRAIALSQVGMDDMADKELRAHYPQLDRNEKPRLLALAHALNLPSIQITLASRMRNQQQSLDFARYPIPDWKPEGGFAVDPALMYALMRQESGFRISAVSSGGALGLMQLMPQTASIMQKRIAANGVSLKPQTNVTEPILNITLGQNYLQHLMETKLVEGNLFYLLAAYNAGPGRLQDWKRSLDYQDDPLLFVESIPYAQTRNYVMQVMANYWIYSELTGKANYTVHALLHGHWPWYDYKTDGPAPQQVASNG
jgi:soluble lytic murein transglycosylase